jgi:hypothetical protein
MTTANILMIFLGIGCASWCIGLVAWAAYFDQVQRREMIRFMNAALEAILARTGELRRENAKRASAPLG